jgi:SAM-dependent methyltransferase
MGGFMAAWDKFRQEKLQFMAGRCEQVLDFGQSARADKKYFSNDQYKTCDIDPSIKPDILGDICDLNSIADHSFDGIICCAILEHVYNPFKAVEEMFRILKSGGVLFGYVPFLYYYHAHAGHYKDYYRFSEDGIRYLFKDFKNLEIVPVRGAVTTLLNLLPGKLGKIQIFFGWADRFFSARQVSGYNFYVQK